MLTQTDVENNNSFPDAVGFSGHYLDEHLPSFDGGYEVRYYMRPLPFDVPLRSMYSKNIINLLSGGRDIGVSHIVFTSTRIMRTTGLLGQSAAIAAKLCMDLDISLRELANDHASLLQQHLLKHDIFIIGAKSTDELDLARDAIITANSEGSLSKDLDVKEKEQIWKSALNNIGVAIFDYPQKIEKVAFYVRNTSRTEALAKGFLGYGECADIQFIPVPEFVYNHEIGRYEENKETEENEKGVVRDSEDTTTGTAGWAEYYKRVDDIKKYDIYIENGQLVAAGFEGWVTFELPWDKGFPEFDPKKVG